MFDQRGLLWNRRQVRLSRELRGALRDREFLGEFVYPERALPELAGYRLCDAHDAEYSENNRAYDPDQGPDGEEREDGARYCEADVVGEKHHALTRVEEREAVVPAGEEGNEKEDRYIRQPGDGSGFVDLCFGRFLDVDRGVSEGFHLSFRAELRYRRTCSVPLSNLRRMSATLVRGESG
jgi:hypothetical protein